MAAWRELLDSAFANLDELARLAADYQREVQDDPVRLAELERRRDLLYGLFQKYGATTGAVLETGAQAATELDVLDTADIDLRALAARRAAASNALHTAMNQLTERRACGGGTTGSGGEPLASQAGIAGRDVSRRTGGAPGGARIRAGDSILHGTAQYRPG